MAGAFGSYHNYIDILGGLYAAVVNVEAVGESKGLALGHKGLDRLLIKLSLLFVVDEYHDDVGIFGGVGRGHNLKARLFGLCPALAALVKAYDNIYARVTKV